MLTALISVSVAAITVLLIGLFPKRCLGNPASASKATPQVARLNARSHHFHHYVSGRRQHQCSGDEANVIARYFASLSFDHSNCPQDSWIFHLRNVTLHSKSPNLYNKPKVFVNIGVNKGYNFAMWLATWNNEFGLDKSMWYDKLISALRKKDPNAAVDANQCGICFDCKMERPDPVLFPKGAASFETVMVGVDLNSFNIELINSIVSDLGSNSSTSEIMKKAKFQLITAAGGHKDVDGVDVLDCSGSTYEGCRISQSGNLKKVPMLSIDTLVKNLASQKLIHSGPNSIDVLMVDTEGHDPLVIFGSNRTLRHGIARVYMFEYHEYCPWPNYSLKAVVEHFDSMNYACYIISNKGRFWLLSGTCFDPLYDFHGWGNVFCIKMDDPWHLPISRLVVTREAAEKALNMGGNINTKYKTKDRPICSPVDK